MLPSVNDFLPPKEVFTNGFTLGLDIGTNSVGWALVGESPGQIAAGVRIFPQGTERQQGGGEVSRATNRREARLRRRLIERRKRRWKKTAHFLVEAGLLPAKVDAETFSTGDPYALRRRALVEKLEPFELGRAIYHLSKRRGFLSNAKRITQEEAED